MLQLYTVYVYLVVNKLIHLCTKENALLALVNKFTRVMYANVQWEPVLLV